MQFIGIGFKNSDAVNLNFIRDKAAKYDLLASKIISEGGFIEGLTDFSSHFELDCLQLAAFNADDRKASSRQISDELSEFNRVSKESSFLNFLSHEKDGFPDVYYVIFACDWNQADPTRLVRLASNELKTYFKFNNSWYLWLYNYSAKRYYPKLDLPLVLEINNKNHIGS
ncbi:hypothetical protein [Fluviicola taffensis]|uniref:Uncharacterized protein n=1 Tax=Fluviicola taffensis (strain DSM 16823 / NCIMB 13979 / RW262) TaxID=755732 RepID=F2IB99_FLUTR|nr:hypothetical protein [Fluviicola taffensis]AEA43185.1 hypothetical protein Fluta_1190 [Fluviicola taffensis DSM 16823]